jgi:hypothetical protein
MKRSFRGTKIERAGDDGKTRPSGKLTEGISSKIT